MSCNNSISHQKLILLYPGNLVAIRNNKSSKLKEFLWTSLFHELFFSGVFTVCTIIIVPFFIQEDPAYFILQALSPTSGFETTIAGKLVRSLVQGLLGYHWLMGSAYITSAELQMAYLFSEILNCIVRDSRWFRKCLRERFICYSILMRRFNNIFRWTAATGLGGSAGVVVCCLSATIKFHTLIPTFVLIAFVFLALTIMILISTILPNAASVHERSMEYVYTLKARVLIRTSSRLEYDIRISRATQAVSFESGCFTTIDKQSILMWYMTVLEQSINVLLGF
ncbi:hypothetical protein Fcan01_25659 [Folsomia candida]|uniref:Uncharacterized protein n=1 Tax=Folsomia candida TaxID=158441 RepID=A0A226D5S1_FOLCA|nr:hypothetical protein Fcan01_25659 [Folsomia candida]